ncbi:MAG TPA: hypothetical protein VFT16_02790 [Candidatus Saccharimonadales bacterium]|nr:hypothetical protein [Candidatus Saccharimonadales bacterium]
MIDWLAAIFGDKSIRLDFLKFRRGKTTNSKSKQTTKQRAGNNNGQVNQGPVNQVINNGPVLNFNVYTNADGSLSPEAVEALKPLIDQFENKQVAFLAEDSQQLITDIKNHEQDPYLRGLLKFFKHRLTPADYQLMRTGLYLKFLRENRKTEEAKKLWAQTTAGQRLRERRVIELASADYFGTFFRPLFKQLMKADALVAQKRFDKEYEAILSDMRFAIFVHGGMKEDEIVDKVVKKAISNIRYGVKAEVISLHATGTTQVQRVKSAIKKLRNTFPAMTVSTKPSGTEIIRVDIEYRKNDIDEALLADDVVDSE